MIKIYIFEQLFTSKGLEYAIAVLAMFVFIFFYYVLSTKR
jgi:predicted permease